MKVVLAVGLPGSGKSSWFERQGIVPLSSDYLRMLLADDITEQRFQDVVFTALRYLLELRFQLDRPVTYIDATNLTVAERALYIRIARQYGAEVEAIYFDTPLAVCQTRNRARGRVVPEDAMLRLAERLIPPSLDEGFSKITTIR